MKNATTQPMDALLRSLLAQEKAAADEPGRFSPGLWIGTHGCHKAVAEGLLARGLVVESERCGFRQIDLNDQGRARALQTA